MYLKKSTNKKNGRTYLSIASGYRDKSTGKPKTVLIKSLDISMFYKKSLKIPLLILQKLLIR